jgi:hypothetical protein
MIDPNPVDGKQGGDAAGAPSGGYAGGKKPRCDFTISPKFGPCPATMDPDLHERCFMDSVRRGPRLFLSPPAPRGFRRTDLMSCVAVHIQEVTLAGACAGQVFFRPRFSSEA